MVKEVIMSRLFQIQLSNGSVYITRESDAEEFYKSKIYKLRRGCVVKNTMAQGGQGSIQLFNISVNTFFDLPIIIKSDCINEVVAIKKDSELDRLYLKVTSGIVIAEGNQTLN